MSEGEESEQGKEICDAQSLEQTPAAEVQRCLTRYYGLDGQPLVDDFVRVQPDHHRERLLVRDGEEGLEVRLELPAHALKRQGPRCLDKLCQLVEGVSHFVLVAERARCELPTTQLELELQAEIDKFVVLAIAGSRLDADTLHGRLFGEARFLHAKGTERGDRYRLAHRLAARFTRRLSHQYVRRARFGALRGELRRFYRGGQSSKIAMARAA